MTEDMSKHILKDMLDRMPDRTSENILNKITEDLRTIIYINIIMGITRNKIISNNYFDFEMCFRPQWHALFRHLKFQK